MERVFWDALAENCLHEGSSLPDLLLIALQLRTSHLIPGLAADCITWFLA